MTEDNRIQSVVIVGARGRMGKALISEVLRSEDLALVSAVEHTGAPGIGDDIGHIHGLPTTEVTLVDRLDPPRGSVVIDFSLPQATPTVVEQCRQRGIPLVLGTTGVDNETLDKLERAAAEIPIVFAANYSVGVTLLLKLAGIAAKALGAGWDAEIVELHHRHKRDAPSGTALRVGKAIADARRHSLGEIARTVRDGEVGPRTDEEIGIMTLRGGDSVGEHTVMFLSASERLELVHRATDRAIFAKGAIRAARWVAQRQSGLYDMADVLGLGDLGA